MDSWSDVAALLEQSRVASYEVGEGHTYILIMENYMARPKQDLWQRLARKAVQDPETGCIVWKGATTYGGYPLTEADGKTQTVARLVYTKLHGDIDKGEQVSHKCNNKLCINPDHLFLSRKKRDAI